MVEVLKILFSVGSSIVMGQIEKSAIQNKNQKQLSKLQAETKEYVDGSIEELYQRIESKFANDIRSLMIVSRFLLVGFAVILVLLITLIVLLVLR